jgi:hypothetical protein
VLTPDDAERTVRLPVQWDGEKWRMESGEALPKLVARACGELILPAVFLADKAERASWTGQQVLDFLPKQTPLFARVSPKFLSAKMADRTVERFLHRRRVPFLPLVLQEDVRLVLVPGKKGYLVGGKCHCPDFMFEADSLNEALRKVSEQFEPTRRSYGGSAFELIYAEINTRLVKLADYRDRVCDAIVRERSSYESPNVNRSVQSGPSNYGTQKHLDF